MKKLFVITFLLLSFTAFCQDINVQITILPPYTTKLADLIDKPGKSFVFIQNKSNINYEVYFKINITGPNGISISTAEGYQPLKSLTLSPFQALQLDASAMDDYLSTKNFVYSGINRSEIERTGNLPEGTYRFCITVYNFRQPNQLLSRAENCNDFRFALIDPPLLISPNNFADVKYMQPQNVIFNWALPAGLPQGTTYLLRIVELLDPKRDPNDAIRSATFPIFFEKQVRGNMYVYGPADPPLVDGRKYVWGIKLLDQNNINGSFFSIGSAFKNNGNSEIFTFTATENKAAIPIAGINPPPLQGKPKDSAKNNLPAIDTNFISNNNNLPFNQFRFEGRLTWGFLKSESGVISRANQSNDFNLIDQIVQQQGNNLAFQNNINVNYNNSFNSQNNYVLPSGNGVGNYNVQFPANNNNGNNQLTPQQIRQQIRDQVSNTRRPLTGTQINIYLIDDSTQNPLRNNFNYNGELVNGQRFNIQQQNNRRNDILLGTATTDEDGRFVLTYNGLILPGFRLKLVVANNHFYYVTDEITARTNANGTYLIGELIGIAKTFRFSAIVKDANYRLPIPETDVTIFRNEGFYQRSISNENFRFEIMREQLQSNTNFQSALNQNNQNANKPANNGFQLQEQSPQPNVSEVCATGKNGDVFGNLFFSSDANNLYGITLSSPNRFSENFTFNVRDSGNWTIEGGVPTVTREYYIHLPNPQVTGRILVGNSDVAVAGKSVQILPQDLRDCRNPREIIDRIKSVQTNNDGSFTLENIPVWNKPYKLVFFYKGETYVIRENIRLDSLGKIHRISDYRAPIESMIVCGTIKDAANQPIANALLTWRDGGAPFYSNGEGNFITSQIGGQHILIVKAPGYKSKEVTIQVSANNEQNVNRRVQVFATSNGINLNDVANFLQTAQVNIPFNLANFAQAGNQLNVINAQHLMPQANQHDFSYLFRDADYVSNQSSCGHIVRLNPYKVLVNVTDVNSNPLRGVRVSTLGGLAISGNTNNNGRVLLNGFSAGSFELMIKGATDTSSFIVQKIGFDIDRNADTTILNVILRRGGIINGIVTNNANRPIAGATISLDGFEEFQVQSGGDGRFTLYGLPLGINSLKAEKQGKITATSQKRLRAGQIDTANFQLADQGFAATSIYGFPITVDAVTNLGNNRFRISGSIKEISYNSTFTAHPSLPINLHFTNIEVTGNNTLTPVAGKIVLDETSLMLKAFDAVTVKVEDVVNRGSLKIKPRNNGSGLLSGKVTVDIGRTFESLTNIAIPENSLKLRIGNTDSVDVLNNLGTFNAANLRLYSINPSIELFGFNYQPVWANCTIDRYGLLFTGSIRINNVPLVENNTISIAGAARLNWYGRVDSASLQVNANPQFQLGSWRFQLANGRLNEYGFTVGGNMRFTLPGSAESIFRFEQLRLTTDGISGGDFFLPNNGFDVYNTIRVTAPNVSPYSLVRNGNNYSFTGAAAFRLPYINDELQIDRFTLSTSGDFSINARVDYQLNLADMAAIQIRSIGFETANARIHLSGGFKLQIPGIAGANVNGSLHFGRNYFEADELGISVSLLAGIRANVGVRFANGNSFGGRGELAFAGMPGIGVDFAYTKQRNGYAVGAGLSIATNIPLGTFSIIRLGGRFELNTNTETFAININADANITGDPMRPFGGTLEFRNINAGIIAGRDGVILNGGARMALMNLNVARTDFSIDFGNTSFHVSGNVGANTNFFGGITLNAGGDFTLDMKYRGANSYLLFVANARVNVLRISRVQASFAIGWNVPMNLVSELADQMPNELKADRKFSGFFCMFSSNIHLGGSFGNDIASVSVNVNQSFEFKIYLNAANGRPNLGAYLYGGVSAGVSVEIFGWDAFSVDMELSGSVAASYNGGWNASANFHGYISAHIGKKGGCNGIKWCGCCLIAKYPCGARVCVGADATVSYSEQNGFDIDF